MRTNSISLDLVNSFLNVQLSPSNRSSNILFKFLQFVFVVYSCSNIETSKITKILNSEDIQNGKSPIKWQNQMIKHIKRMDKNSYS